MVVELCIYLDEAVTPLVRHLNNTYTSFVKPAEQADLAPAEVKAQEALIQAFKMLCEVESIRKVRPCMHAPIWQGREGGKQLCWAPSSLQHCGWR